ncbi:MAG: aldehyde:ferredoxin oxidoreductase [Anaerolinea sp.]|nr:aldehyde:ferredoxin oxidoreductase [Anaerolinea sp.]
MVIASPIPLKEFTYELKPVIHGYAGRTLHIDLETRQINIKPVDQRMIDTFTGGKGFCLWLLWNAIDSKTKWNDPKNELAIAGGPIGGITAYPGSGKCTVVTLSPLTKSIMDSNGGGNFGPYLKFSGFDALEIQGKAEQDVIIVIDGDTGRVTIEDAQLDEVNTHLLSKQLTERFGKTDREKRGITVMSAGRAAEHVPICGLNISYWDTKRQEVRIKQAARGGSGTVLRDKKIKAIVVIYSGLSGDSNGAANMELIRKAGQRINKEIADFDAHQNDMRHFGTPYLVEIMNYYDILPVQNFRYGSDPDAVKINGEVWKSMFDFRGPDGCWYGCSLQCAHGVPHYHLQSGPYKGDVVFVDGPEYESLGALGSNLGIFDPQAMLELCFYCDTYGIDTISAGNSMAFAFECYEKGIINREITGGLELTWGNASAAYELLHQMARGEGFGVTVGQGVRVMKSLFAQKYGADPAMLQDMGMEIKGLEISEYISRESLAQQGGYAMASKGPQHDEAWLIFMDMVHKQLPTFEAKAEALHYFPVWRTWFSLHGLCKLPWNDIIPESNKTAKEPAKVPEHVENYCWLYEGLTGKKTQPEDLMLQSERVYNFQRLFNLRMGFGTRAHDYPPYRLIGPATVEEYENRAELYDKQLREVIGVESDGLSTTEKIRLVRKYRENQYEQLMDAVYKRRGWTNDGVPTLETVQRLGIDFPEVVEMIKGCRG